MIITAIRPGKSTSIFTGGEIGLEPILPMKLSMRSVGRMKRMFRIHKIRKIKTKLADISPKVYNPN